MFLLKSLKTLNFKRLDLREPLIFPEGRLLIHGRNESGKSTILEAIHYALYGDPLRPKRNAPNEDIIRYDAGQALVELVFSIDDVEYTVKRILKIKGNNEHELTIRRGGAKIDRITKATRVNTTILEALHGIDSEALLNSCLVEQKQLDKLEGGNKSDRVKALTSLLNLDAFVDAQKNLKEDSKRLQLEHTKTEALLQEAEAAKGDYEDAEVKKAEAEAHLSEIGVELSQVNDLLTHLTSQLGKLGEARQFKNEISQKTIEKNGIVESIRRLEKELREANDAETRVNEIESQLPTLRKNLVDAAKRVQDIEALTELESQKRDLESRSQSAERIAEEKRQQLQDAVKATDEAARLRSECDKFTGAKEAAQILPEVETVVKFVDDEARNISETESKFKILEEKLTSLKTTSERVETIETRRNTLVSSKSSVQRARTIGISIAVLGALSTIASIINLLALVAGIPLLLTGIILVSRNNPSKYDAEVASLNLEREGLLGDTQRITEYNNSKSILETQLRESRGKLASSKTKLDTVLLSFPDNPRKYSLEFEQGKVVQLRDSINNDFRTLTRLETELNAARQLSSKQYELEIEVQAHEEEVKASDTILEAIEQSINELQRASGLLSTDSERIREGRDRAVELLKGAEAEGKVCKESASKIPNLDSELSEKRELRASLEDSLALLNGELEKTLQDAAASLEDEPRIRHEASNTNSRIGSLNTELVERKSDSNEAEETMNVSRPLKEKYPELLDNAKNEKLEISATEKAMKLLEATRDGIVGGVKGGIEARMAQLLPPLTDGRYSLVKIDENEYRIEVYDREARSWRSKAVFSGGTQDQFSLALRLAFAISTIPETRGARPGFIFLDEPLSSFDTQRRRGFMELIIGELPKSFPQIIVISHIEQLQEEFLNQIQLESGRLVV